MNIASHLDRWAEESPHKAALRTAEGELSYGELHRWAGDIAAELSELGLARGDRVGVLAGSNAEFVATVYGIWKLGAAAVLLNPQLATGDVERQTLSAGAGVIVVDADPDRWAMAADVARTAGGVRAVRTARRRARTERRAAAAAPTVEPAPRDIAVIAYTSGTTGLAKGAAHTHGAMLTQVEMVGAHYSATSADEILSLLPLFLFSIFVVGPVLALSLGATCRIMARYDALTAVRSIEEDGTTIAAAVPLFFHDLRELANEHGADFDLSSLRVVTSGGAPLPEDIRDDFESRFGFRLVQLYGMTEAPAIVTSDPMSGDRRTGSVGRALPHLRVTVMDEAGRELPPGAPGEVCVSPVTDGPFAGRYTAMACYWDMPEQTAEALRDGKLHTGDIGFLDGDGFLYLVDRKKDIIIRGGMNVYPREIELVLSGDDRIAECAVVGRPHPRYGEVPTAYVRLRPGARTEADELLGLVNGRIPSSHRLDALHLVDDFPRNSLGKILRRELGRSHAREGTAHE